MKLMRVRMVALILIIGSLDEHYGAVLQDARTEPRSINGYNADNRYLAVASVFFKGLDDHLTWSDKEEYDIDSPLEKSLRHGYLGVGAGLEGQKPMDTWRDRKHFRRVKQVYRHPEYDENIQDGVAQPINDLALLELNEPFINISDAVYPQANIGKFCIDNENRFLSPGKQFYLISYGYQYEKTQEKSIASKYGLFHNEENQQLRYLYDMALNNFDPKCQGLNSICARSKRRSAGTCYGDEGAPLIVMEKEHYLIGVVSYTIGAENATHFTCKSGQTARVTLLSPYAYWISSILKGELCINGGPITPPTTPSTTTTTTQKPTTTTQRTTTKKPTTESISTTVEYVNTTTESPSTTEESDGTKDWTLSSRKPINPDDSSHTDARTVTSPNECRTKSINPNVLLIIAVIILLIFSLILILIIVKNRYTFF